MKIKSIFSLAVALLILTACSQKPSEDYISKKCIKDNIDLKETQVRDLKGTSNIVVSFDMTNKGKEDYDTSNQSIPMKGVLMIETTDGNMYESIHDITITKLPSGSTTKLEMTAQYAKNKEFKNYEVALLCSSY